MGRHIAEKGVRNSPKMMSNLPYVLHNPSALQQRPRLLVHVDVLAIAVQFVGLKEVKRGTTLDCKHQSACGYKNAKKSVSHDVCGAAWRREM